MKKIILSVLILMIFFMGIHCASWSNSGKGAAIGAVAGGVVGGVIGKATGNTARGAILGAVIGGAAGAIIGDYMDRQAEEIERDIEGAQVERVGEGIKITFDSGILFKVNKSDLLVQSEENIAKLAEILNKYEDTEILLEGHTDATGSEEYNLELSRKRAHSVSNSLTNKEVKTSRITMMGYGETQPIADNETIEGRTQNRRVEIAIYANDKLKKVAKKKAEG
ncbi:OmpA family protein [bacterium]